MKRLVPTLAALVALAAPLAATSAQADATATVRAMMAEITGAPIRQVRAPAAATIRARADARALVAGSPEAMVLRAVGAPARSLRPLARPVHLMRRFDGCGPNGERLSLGNVAPLVLNAAVRVCALPLETVAPRAAAPMPLGSFTPRTLVTLPSAAPGQMVIVTDGHARVYSLSR